MLTGPHSEDHRLRRSIRNYILFFIFAIVVSGILLIDEVRVQRLQVDVVTESAVVLIVGRVIKSVQPNLHDRRLFAGESSEFH